MPELATRVASALVLAALAIGAALVSPWTFLLLVIAASCVIAWEWGRLTRGDGSDRIAAVQMIGVALALTFVALGRPAFALGALGLTALGIAAASAGAQSLSWALAGLAYAALPGAALVWLRSDAALGAVAVIYLLAVASTADTAAYAAGRLIGGPKLAPRVSPNKTWSGFAAGLLAPALVGVAFAAYLGGTSAASLAFVSVALALACQMGDLIESAAKRRFGTKDMSALIPGHGGLLDRIDSLLLAAVLAATIALRDPANPASGLLIW
jgi:phosphatidate cytidylyltransferase